MFFDFLIVTRSTPGTGFMPSFCIALRDFFSLRLCLEEPARARGKRRGNGWKGGQSASRGAGGKVGLLIGATGATPVRRWAGDTQP